MRVKRTAARIAWIVLCCEENLPRIVSGAAIRHHELIRLQGLVHKRIQQWIDGGVQTMTTLTSSRDGASQIAAQLDSPKKAKRIIVLINRAIVPSSG